MKTKKVKSNELKVFELDQNLAFGVRITSKRLVEGIDEGTAKLLQSILDSYKDDFSRTAKYIGIKPKCKLDIELAVYEPAESRICIQGTVLEGHCNYGNITKTIARLIESLPRYDKKDKYKVNYFMLMLRENDLDSNL